MTTSLWVPGLALLFVLGAATPARALTPAELDAWIDANECTSIEDEECLEAIAHSSCAWPTSCWRHGRNFRGSVPGRVDIHMTLGYLRHLRNTAQAYPTAVIANALPAGATLDEMVWHQIQALLLAPNARFYADDGTRLALDAVKSGNTVDPTRFHSVTWVTERLDGCPESQCPVWASAMTQADFGRWLITVARGETSSGDRTYDLRLAERVFRSYGIRAADGGVRNDRTGHRCHAGLYCYWFHSWVAETPPEPGVVLNQHLHAVRDALAAHQMLADWRDEAGTTLPAEFHGAWIAQLREWGRGGLFQLAFALGNDADASAPPNLEELMWPAGASGGHVHSHAAYRFDLGEGAFNIAAANTCHYHFHSMQVLYDILSHISTSSRFTGDPHFVDIYYGLLYDRAPGDARACGPSVPVSLRDTTGVPAAELYLSSLRSMVSLPFHASCTTTLDAAAESFYAAAYEGCSFDGI